MHSPLPHTITQSTIAAHLVLETEHSDTKYSYYDSLNVYCSQGCWYDYNDVCESLSGSGYPSGE